MRRFAHWFAPVVAALCVGLAASDAPAQDADKLEEAKKHMAAGAAFYNDPSGHKCEEALREFKKAYDLSGSLNALKAMGVCALELERDGEAITHYEKFLEKLGGKDHPDKAQVENDLKALKAGIAWVTISADRPNVRITDVRTPAKGYPITNRYTASSAAQKLGIHPGQHVFTASVDGEPDQVWKIDIANGTSHERTFNFDTGKPMTAEGATSADLGHQQPDKPAQTERPVPVTVFIFGGLTAALAVPTVIFMVRAGGLKSDYDAANGTQPAAALEDQKSEVQTGNLIADIFLGATVASAAATAVFYFTRPEVPSTQGLVITPTVGQRGGGAFVTGRF